MNIKFNIDMCCVFSVEICMSSFLSCVGQAPVLYLMEGLYPHPPGSFCTKRVNKSFFMKKKACC